MNLHVGTSGYAYKEWKGRFYPEDLPASQMLRFYASHFHTVEINNTFYRMPKASVLEAWAADVGPGFKFVLKAPQRITHFQRLKNAADPVWYLLDTARVLQDQLGAILFQLPPNLPKEVARLRAFLGLIPPEQRVAFEFRHPSWFDDEVLRVLQDHQAALCIADASDDLRVPMVATADWGYLRLRRPDYDAAALESWAKRVWEQPWRQAFVFFKHEDEARGPELAKKFLELAAVAEPVTAAGR